jgi:hypothetical protein
MHIQWKTCMTLLAPLILLANLMPYFLIKTSISAVIMVVITWKSSKDTRNVPRLHIRRWSVSLKTALFLPSLKLISQLGNRTYSAHLFVLVLASFHIELAESNMTFSVFPLPGWLPCLLIWVYCRWTSCSSWIVGPGSLAWDSSAPSSGTVGPGSLKWDSSVPSACY